MDPRLETVGVPRPRELPPGEDEGVLQRVLGEARVAQDPERNRIERVADLAHKDADRLNVAPKGLRDEVSIHLDLRLPRPDWPRSPLLTEGWRSNVQMGRLRRRPGVDSGHAADPDRGRLPADPHRRAAGVRPDPAAPGARPEPAPLQALLGAVRRARRSGAAALRVSPVRGQSPALRELHPGVYEPGSSRRRDPADAALRRHSRLD